MRFLGLDLPPLTLIMLLAFLWLLLLVLLLWGWLRPRSALEPLESLHQPAQQPRRQSVQPGHAASDTTYDSPYDTVSLPRPQVVREIRTEPPAPETRATGTQPTGPRATEPRAKAKLGVKPETKPGSNSEQPDDPFDSYKPNSRNDDFDF